MSRLIAFGDSYTYGHWLDDCVPPNDTQPSKLAWPEVLGNRLGLEVHNMSSPGAGNLEILDSILSFHYSVDDLVVIGWTYSSRDIIYKRPTLDNKKFTRISIWNDDDVTACWQKVHTEYDMAVRSGLYIHHAEVFLENLKIRQVHFMSMMPKWKIFSYETGKRLPQWKFNPKYLVPKVILPTKDYAQDKKHPGMKSNQIAADRLYREINETK